MVSASVYEMTEMGCCSGEYMDCELIGAVHIIVK